MTPNASPETIRATAAAIGRAALFDDRITASDAGRIAAWAEALEPFGFTKNELIDGVTKHYQAADANTIKVGDLIAASRELRKQHAERDRGHTDPPQFVRTDPQLGLPIAGADGDPIAAAYEGIHRPIDVHCPHCRALAGEPCVNPHSRQTRKIPCPRRLATAKKHQPAATDSD